MHYTLHLTNNCNMACDYCYVDKSNIQNMSFDIVKKVIEKAVCEKQPVGIVFFGGEPLLQKEIIYKAVEYGKKKENYGELYLYYKITTNGLLLDKEFIDFSIRENIFIALSHDGIQQAHDCHRVDSAGQGTFSDLSPKIDLLLAVRPYASVLIVVTPETVQYYAESVEYLYNRGFRYLVCSLNYAGNWTEEKLRELKKQYIKLADFYTQKTFAEEKFYLSPFEVKISSHITRNTYSHERCELGKKQISVAPDGTLYPCVQFVGNLQYSIGHIDTGIDVNRQNELYNVNEQEKETCRDCAIRLRCNHHCGCMNKQSTGSIQEVLPVLCAHERMLIPIADRIAEKLYKKRNAMFIQKHYNDMYPLISMIEDSTARK